MKTIEKIAAGIALVTGLGLATYGIIEKTPGSAIYTIVPGATLTGVSIGSYLRLREKYLPKE